MFPHSALDRRSLSLLPKERETERGGKPWKPSFAKERGGGMASLCFRLVINGTFRATIEQRVAKELRASK